MNRLQKTLLVTLVAVIAAGIVLPSATAQMVRDEADFIYARRLYQDGLYDLAAEALERYLKQNPEGPQAAEAAYLIGQSHWQEGRYDEARRAFQRTAMDYPDQAVAVDALVQVGEAYLKLGEREKAARAFLRVPVFYPNTSDAPTSLVRAARILVELDKHAEAEAPVQQVLKQYPDSPEEPEARLVWSRILAVRGNLESAIREAGRVAEQTSRSPLAVEALGLQGEWYWRLGRDTEAEAAWQRILDEHQQTPEHASALVHMARRRLQIGDAPQALPLLQRAVAVARDSSLIQDARRGYADALLMLERHEQALEQYRALTAADTPEVRFLRAWCLEQLGRSRDALDAYSILAAENSGDLGRAASLRAAGLLGETGRWRDAAQRYLAAEQSAGHPVAGATARFLAIRSLIHTEPGRALEMAERFGERYPTSPLLDDVAMLRGETLVELDRHEEAVRAFNSLARQYPASPLAREAGDRASYLVEYIIREGDPSSKVAGLLAEVAAGMDRRDLALRLGTVYLEELKDYSAAENQFRSVLSDDEADSTRLARARANLIETLWRGYIRWRRGEDAVERDWNAVVRSRASEAAGEIVELLDGLHDPERRDDAVYRLTRLEEDARWGEERTRYLRQAWQSFLADYPDSPYMADAYWRLAQAYMDTLADDTLGQSDPAEWYLSRLQEPDVADSYRVRALFAEAKRKMAAEGPGAALPALQELMEGPASPEKAEAAVLLVRRADAFGIDATMVERTIDWMRREAFYHPDVLEAREALVTLLVQQGRYDTAEEELDALLAGDRPEGPALVLPGMRDHRYAFLQGAILQGRGEFDAARRNYQQYLAHHPQGDRAPSAHLRLAELQREQGYWEQALRHYRWLLDNDPDKSLVQEARRGAARVLFQQEQYEQSLRLAREAAEESVEPDTAFAYDQIAVVAAFRQGRLGEAQDAARSFEDRYEDRGDIESAMARFELERGKYLSRTRRYRDAAGAYERVMKKYEHTRWAAVAQYQLGRDYLENKDYEKGLDLLTELAVEKPEHPIIGRVYWMLGNHYVQHGEVMDGIAKYEQVLEDDAYRDIWPYVYRNMIMAYKQAGFYAGALQAARNYLEEFPDAPDAFDRRMDVALMYHNMGQYDLAISHFRELQPIADVETEAACQFYIAEALEKSGRLAEAVIEYKKVDYLGKRTKMEWAVTALYNAGRCLERLGENRKAQEMYREIVRREGLASPFGRKANEQLQRLKQEAGNG